MKIESLFSVKDKVVLITGGSRGIGRMIAHGFVVNGARVYITARKEHECQETCNELGKFGFCKYICSDLSSEKDINTLVNYMEKNERDGLHVLINNAGTNWSEEFEKYSIKAFQKVVKLNLESVFLLTQGLIEMLKRGSSHDNPSKVINVGSINGIQPPAFPTFAYSASKAGIHMLTRHLAGKLGQFNITVNAIAPGSFPSKMMKETLDSFGDIITKSVPMGRIGKPEDMAAVCIWLSSLGGNYVNGSVITVDGGALVSSSRL